MPDILLNLIIRVDLEQRLELPAQTIAFRAGETSLFRGAFANAAKGISPLVPASGARVFTELDQPFVADIVQSHEWNDFGNLFHVHVLKGLVQRLDASTHLRKPALA